jgi:quinol monooxygenase YgiN
VLVINRFRIVPEPAEDFRRAITAAHTVLADQAGYVGGTVGRNVDDPELWVLETRWESVGTYRRALSAYDVKVTAWPVLAQSIDEPSAYEVVDADGAELNRVEPRVLG